jgi:hypothetical protein
MKENAPAHFWVKSVPDSGKAAALPHGLLQPSTESLTGTSLLRDHQKALAKICQDRLASGLLNTLSRIENEENRLLSL